MTKQEANQQRSLDAFMARKAQFDAVLAELQQASEDHFGADPDAAVWGETEFSLECIRADQRGRRDMRANEGFGGADISNCRK